MGFSQAGQERDAEVKTTQGPVTVLWTTPKFKALRKMRHLQSILQAYYSADPTKVGDVAGVFQESVLQGCRVRVQGLPSEIMDPDLGLGPEDTATAAQIIDGCADADVVEAVVAHVFGQASLTKAEKKALNARPASSSTEEEEPSTGSMTGLSQLAAREAAGQRA